MLPVSTEGDIFANEEQGSPEESPEREPSGETYFLMEAENGMPVRVPASRLDAWLTAQEEIKNGRSGLTLEEQAMIGRIRSKIYGAEETAGS